MTLQNLFKLDSHQFVILSAAHKYNMTYSSVKFGEIEHSVMSIVDHSLICDLVSSWDQVMLSLVIADFNWSHLKDCECFSCCCFRVKVDIGDRC